MSALNTTRTGGCTLELPMSNETRQSRLLYLLAIPALLLAVPSCDGEPTCPYGQKVVRVNDLFETWACVRSSSTSTGSSTKAPTSSSDSSSSSSTADPSVSGATTAAATQPANIPAKTPPSSTPTVNPFQSGPTCGASEPASDEVVVVEKTDTAPTLGPAPSAAADGTYELVQASFYRSTITESAVRTLRATLVVRGRTLTLGAQDTTVGVNPKEGISFLVEGALLTKTCDGAGGDVSAWFFPFPVGQKGEAQISYDSDTSTVRLVVARSDGSTELVFAR